LRPLAGATRKGQMGGELSRVLVPTIAVRSVAIQCCISNVLKISQPVALFTSVLQPGTFFDMRRVRQHQGKIAVGLKIYHTDFQ
jgi:hypothetical protein